MEAMGWSCHSLSPCTSDGTSPGVVSDMKIRLLTSQEYMTFWVGDGLSGERRERKAFRASGMGSGPETHSTCFSLGDSLPPPLNFFFQSYRKLGRLIEKISGHLLSHLTKFSISVMDWFLIHISPGFPDNFGIH